MQRQRSIDSYFRDPGRFVTRSQSPNQPDSPDESPDPAGACSLHRFLFLAFLPIFCLIRQSIAQTTDPYEGSLDRGASRGMRTVEFSVPGDRPPEIGVIPKHLPFADYRGENGSKDIADEQELIRFDFYKVGNTAADGAVGLCPKDNSTSAAVELFAVPDDTPKSGPETPAFCATIRKSSKKVAKFKQTDNKFTTTSTAAIIGYYHVSRALGDICEIEPAVLRTMDIEQHKRVVKIAADLGIHGTVRKSWDLFSQYYVNPRGSSVARILFTNDFRQIYGALEKNARGEEHYAEWLRAGANLSSTRAFQNMADSRSVQAILGSRGFTQANVQALVAMRDMSEMILIDYLMAQSDRLTGGNISDYATIYYQDQGRITSTRKVTEIPAGAASVTVKKLTIVDTDAGLLNQNVFEQKGYLSRIFHMHPKTFARLVDFAQRWKSDPSVKAFFHQECTFSNSQIARFERYLLSAATILQSRKDRGQLRLDLSLDEFFGSQ
jgi:hypothetical protein